VEVLYLPVSFAVKNRIKAWLDLLVERTSRGVAGLVILVFVSVLSLNAAHMSWIVIVLVSAWVALAVALSSEYVRTLRSSLARRDIADFETLPRDQESLTVFEDLLGSPERDEREILYALQLLRGVENEGIIERVRELVSHRSPSVRRAALEHFRGLGAERALAPAELSTRAEDEDARTSAAAIVLWLEVDEDGARRALDTLITNNDWARIRAILDAVSDSSGEVESGLPRPWLEHVVARHGSTSPEERAIAARAIGLLPTSPETDLLPSLASESNLDVARAAITSAGLLRHDPSFDALTSQLGRRPLRLSARRALVRFGTSAIDRLGASLANPGEEPAVRLAIPQVLGEIPDVKCGAVLLGQLPSSNPKLHYQIVKSLGKLQAALRARERSRSSELPRDKIDEVIEWEQKRGWQLVSWLSAFLPTSAAVDSEAHGLLVRALEERCEFARERIFRLLGMIYTSDEMHRAWDRIVNGTPSVRGAALEYLSNVLSKTHARLIPWLEVVSWRKLAAAPRVPSVVTPSRIDAFSAILRSEDHWLAACATAYLSELEAESVTLQSELRSLASHESLFLRQEARRAVGEGRY
jgi:HEAT repeat protein